MATSKISTTAFGDIFIGQKMPNTNQLLAEISRLETEIKKLKTYADLSAETLDVGEENVIYGGLATIGNSCSALCEDGDGTQIATGSQTLASGYAAHSEGELTEATGACTHAEGYGTNAVGDYGSHAEGYETWAVGYSSHAEGDSTIASGENSHAEGYRTTAFGANAHAQNYNALAIGNNTTAGGIYSKTGIPYKIGHLTVVQLDTDSANPYSSEYYGNYTKADASFKIDFEDNSKTSNDTHIKANSAIFIEETGISSIHWEVHEKSMGSFQTVDLYDQDNNVVGEVRNTSAVFGRAIWYTIIVIDYINSKGYKKSIYGYFDKIDILDNMSYYTDVNPQQVAFYMLGNTSQLKNKRLSSASGNQFADGSFASGDGTVASAGGAAFGDHTRAIGNASFTLGYDTTASSRCAVSIGCHSRAYNRFSYTIGKCLETRGDYSMALGTCCKTKDAWSFIWSGDGAGAHDTSRYVTHGVGTFNIKPKDGSLDNIYVGERSLGEILDNILIENVEVEISRWNKTTAYSVGDKVAYQQKLYECIQDVEASNSFDTSKWKRIKISVS